MNTYKVIAAGGISIHAGILGLSASQADKRIHRLKPLGDGRYEVTDPPVWFKRGEFFRFEGDLPKALWRSIEPCGPRPRALAKAQTRNARKRRWVKRNEVCEKVLHDWEEDPFRFGSAAEAGRHYTELLAKEGYHVEPRTVRDWILDHAKKRGIKLLRGVYGLCSVCTVSVGKVFGPPTVV